MIGVRRSLIFGRSESTVVHSQPIGPLGLLLLLYVDEHDEDVLKGRSFDLGYSATFFNLLSSNEHHCSDHSKPREAWVSLS